MGRGGEGGGGVGEEGGGSYFPVSLLSLPVGVPVKMLAVQIH